MKAAGKDVAFICLDGFDVRGVTTALDDGVEPVLEETTPLGTNWPTHEDTGTRRAELAFSGFYDNGTASIIEALREEQGVSRVVGYGFEGNVVGGDFTGVAGALTSKFVRNANLNGFSRASGSYVVSGRVDHGVILHPLAAESDDGDTEDTPVDYADDVTVPLVPIVASSEANPSVIETSRPHGLATGQIVLIADHAGSTPAIDGEHEVTVVDPTHFSIDVEVTTAGAGGTVRPVSTLSGGAAYCHCVALTLDGATNLAPAVVASDDDITYSELVAFTPFTAVGGQRVETTDPVDRYLAADWAYTDGAGDDTEGRFLIGFARY